MKKIVSFIVVMVLLAGLTACSGTSGENGNAESETQTEVQVFAAASLNTVLTELVDTYETKHPGVHIVINADSSGTLLNQIKEGYECDIFFSAAEKQMDMLEEEGLIIDGTRADVLNNQVVLIALKNSGTKVTGLQNLGEAESIALAGGSVPVGKYTREAMVNMGLLEKGEEVDKITAKQISEALGGVEISEQDNVSKVLIAVTEGACEVGTTYYSDIYGYEDQVEVLERVSYELTGDVIYPVCRVKNDEADEAQKKTAEEFYQFLLSEEAKEVFARYYFDTNINESIRSN